jgi:hypothetical protein
LEDRIADLERKLAEMQADLGRELKNIEFVEMFFVERRKIERETEKRLTALQAKVDKALSIDVVGLPFITLSRVRRVLRGLPES